MVPEAGGHESGKKNRQKNLPEQKEAEEIEFPQQTVSQEETLTREVSREEGKTWLEWAGLSRTQGGRDWPDPPRGALPVDATCYTRSYSFQRIHVKIAWSALAH